MKLNNFSTFLSLKERKWSKILIELIHEKEAKKWTNSNYENKEMKNYSKYEIFFLSLFNIDFCSLFFLLLLHQEKKEYY